MPDDKIEMVLFDIRNVVLLKAFFILFTLFYSPPRKPTRSSIFDVWVFGSSIFVILKPFLWNLNCKRKVSTNRLLDLNNEGFFEQKSYSKNEDEIFFHYGNSQKSINVKFA